jgi:hemolysin activation/secretion protein
LGFWAIATRAEAVEAPFDQLDIESETESYAIDFTHPFIRNLNTELSIFGSAEVRQSQSFLFGEGFQFSEGLEEDGIARATGSGYSPHDPRSVAASMPSTRRSTSRVRAASSSPGSLSCNGHSVSIGWICE